MRAEWPRFRPGEAPRATKLAELAARLRWVLSLRVTPPLVLQNTPAGPLLALAGGASETGLWAKLTARNGSGLYTWIEQLPEAAGAWSDGPRSGSPSGSPAREVNGATVDMPTIVWLIRVAPEDYRFQGHPCCG